MIRNSKSEKVRSSCQILAGIFFFFFSRRKKETLFLPSQGGILVMIFSKEKTIKERFVVLLVKHRIQTACSYWVISVVQLVKHCSRIAKVVGSNPTRVIWGMGKTHKSTCMFCVVIYFRCSKRSESIRRYWTSSF